MHITLGMFAAPMFRGRARHSRCNTCAPLGLLKRMFKKSKARTKTNHQGRGRRSEAGGFAALLLYAFDANLLSLFP